MSTRTIRKLVVTALSLLVSTSSYAIEFPSSGMYQAIGALSFENMSPSERLLFIPTGDKDVLSFETGYLRQFQLSELDNVYIAFSRSKKKIKFAIGYSQLGELDLYREKQVKLLVSYRVKGISLNISVTRYDWEFGNNYTSISKNSLSLALAGRNNKLNWAILSENLNSPQYNNRLLGVERSHSLLLDYKANSTTSIFGSSKFLKNEKPQFAIAQRNNLSSYSTIFFGVSSNPLKYAFGLEIRHKKQKISYSVSFHDELGLSHYISFVYSPNLKQ